MVATKTAAGASAPSALDLIGKMAKAPGGAKGAKKDEKPVLNDPALAEAIETFIANKRMEEDAKALKDVAGAEIRDKAGAFRLAECAARGVLLSSVGVNGRLTFTQTNRYSPVPQEQTAALEAAFGEDYERFFKPTFKIALSERAANNEAILAELTEKLGLDFVQANFDIRRDLLVQDAFHTRYATDKSVQAIAGAFLADQTIKPYQASLKIT